MNHSLNTLTIPLPRYHQCFVCGDRNRIGLDVTFYYRNGRIETDFTPKTEHAGYRNVLHGGILATLLDETMGWAAIYSRPVLCVSAELNIRYKTSATVGEPLTVFGELIADKKRVILAKGGILNGKGETICTGEGKYIPLPEKEQKAVALYAQWEDALEKTYKRITEGR